MPSQGDKENIRPFVPIVLLFGLAAVAAIIGGAAVYPFAPELGGGAMLGGVYGLAGVVAILGFYGAGHLLLWQMSKRS